jgi:mRNA-degrading endonuclease YafQ of YafQ-DinJ toxin-antitoxin module
MTRKDYTALANAFVKSYKETLANAHDVNVVLENVMSALSSYENFDREKFRTHIISGLNA